MGDDLDTPNCSVHLMPMQVAGTVEDPEWWCPDCAWDNKPWTSLVIAPGEMMHHGRNTRDLDWTLCGAVGVTDVTVYRGPFFGSEEGDCPTCADLLRYNHY